MFDAAMVSLQRAFQYSVRSTHLSSDHQLAGAWMSGLISYKGKDKALRLCATNANGMLTA